VDVISHLAFPDAHNLFLTSAAESGLVGLAGFILSVAAYVLASRRTWSSSPTESRPIVVAALFGLAVVAGHAMVEVVFALIGVVLLTLGVLALATTPRRSTQTEQVRRRGGLDLALVTGLTVLVVATVGVVQRETVLDDVAAADERTMVSPQVALALAQRATEADPRSVPAWWVRMVAEDAAGDGRGAIDAAQKITDLEGFGQEWMSLAVLMHRDGDVVGALDALGRARDHPPADPTVELNAAMLVLASSKAQLSDVAGRLLAVQPDVEPALVGGPLADAVAAARRDVASSVVTTDASLAFTIALLGEDSGLARDLLARVGVEHPDEVAPWQTIIDAWFGSEQARAIVESRVASDPGAGDIRWAWRLAARSCDTPAIERWERALEIAVGQHPSTPIKIGVAPGFAEDHLPVRYPGVPWRMDFPRDPYVQGVWTIQSGRPACIPRTGR
jgi:Flp pilus assembly protein TadD